jgi:NAD(P)-dependent dehydrogenase (short-subunit alcohol dehydrogenase family)
MSSESPEREFGEARCALVTGASRGIGAGIARCLAEAGYDLIICGRDASTLAAVAEPIRRRGGAVRTEEVDLTVRSQVLQLAERCAGVSVLVNNAGTDQMLVPFLEANDEYWQRVLEVDLWVPYVLMREVGKHMARRGQGSIINITSTAGTIWPLPGLAHYAAAKAALEAVTKVAAMELGRMGVRCNAIAPGFIETQHSGAVLTESLRTQVLNAIPLRRVGTPDEIGAMAVFLASDKASYITGQQFVVDGGSVSGGAYQVDRVPTGLA